MNKKIQILRAIAIIAVILIHTVPNNHFIIYIRPFINYAVALFIFLSGYLTKINIDNISKFYKKRLSRVLIPYIIWSILYTLATSNEFSINLFFKLIKNILTTKGCYTFYYIAVYVQLVLITPFLGKIINSKFKWIGWLIQPTFIFMIRYVFVYLGITIESPWNGYFFISWFSYYYLGILLGNNIIKLSLHKKKFLIIYLITLIVQVIEGFIWYNFFDNIDIAISQIKISTMISSMVFLILCYFYIIDNKLINNQVNNILNYVGNNAFGIYLCHPAILIVLNKFQLYKNIPFPISSIIIISISLVFILLGRKIVGKKISKYIGLI